MKVEKKQLYILEWTQSILKTDLFENGDENS